VVRNGQRYTTVPRQQPKRGIAGAKGDAVAAGRQGFDGIGGNGDIHADAPPIDVKHPHHAPVSARDPGDIPAAGKEPFAVARPRQLCQSATIDPGSVWATDSSQASSIKDIGRFRTVSVVVSDGDAITLGTHRNRNRNALVYLGRRSPVEVGIVAPQPAFVSTAKIAPSAPKATRIPPLPYALSVAKRRPLSTSKQV
jgi:hypothetical protein